MNIYLKKIIIIFLLILINIITNKIFKILDNEWSKPVKLTFELPFPEEEEKKYGFSPDPEEVDFIIVAGFFSEWNPKDLNYKMTRISTTKWEISLKLEPGRNQYKYVLYCKNDNTPYWVYDKNSKIKVDDKFGGYNSVIEIKSTRTISFVFNLLTISLITIMTFYFFTEKLINYFLKLKMKYKTKLIIIIIIILSLSNIIFIFYNIHEQRETIKEVFIECANLIHHFLLSEGVDFDKLEDPNELRKIEEGVKKFFWNVKARLEKNKHSNIQSSLSGILLFDKNLNLLFISGRKELKETYTNLAKYYKMSNITQYFIEGRFGDILKDIWKNISNNQNIIKPWFGKIPKKYTKHSDKEFLESTFLLGYNQLIYPIIHKNKLVGYYGFSLHIHLFGFEIKRILLFNFYILLITIFLFFIILSKIGDIITKYLNLLIDWTKSIIHGDFSTEKIIDSNDEIQSLAENFNKMRISLRDNLENLRLINQIINILQKIHEIDDLYNVFLTFITCNFGFKYNRTAIFLKDDNTLKGKYAIGSINKEEVIKKFGSFENYLNLKIDINDFINNYKKYFINNENCFFYKTVINTTIPESNSIFWNSYKENKSINFKNNNLNLSEIDLIICKKLNLKDFAIFPIKKGNEPIGILIIDNLFTNREINDEDINRIEIILNEFSTILYNAYLVENLENLVDIRTYELKKERNLLEKRNEEMEKDLALAREIQLSLIPSKSPLENISFLYKPMNKVGGDFFDFIDFCDNENIGIFISDVSGHGVTAAFITTMIKSVLIQKSKETYSPSNLLRILNETLLNKTADKYISAFYGIYNIKKRELTFANAGHNLPIIIIENNVKYLYSNNYLLPLAVMSEDELNLHNMNFNDEKITININSKLLFYTDGLTETININEYLKGIRKDFENTALIETILKLKDKNAKDFINDIYNKLVEFRGNDIFDDDVCIICLDVI